MLINLTTTEKNKIKKNFASEFQTYFNLYLLYCFSNNSRLFSVP